MLDHLIKHVNGLVGGPHLTGQEILHEAFLQTTKVIGQLLLRRDSLIKSFYYRGYSFLQVKWRQDDLKTLDPKKG